MSAPGAGDEQSGSAQAQDGSEQPSPEQPASEQPASEQPASEQPASEQPASEQPAGAIAEDGTGPADGSTAEVGQQAPVYDDPDADPATAPADEADTPEGEQAPVDHEPAEAGPDSRADEIDTPGGAEPPGETVGEQSDVPVAHGEATEAPTGSAPGDASGQPEAPDVPETGASDSGEPASEPEAPQRARRSRRATRGVMTVSFSSEGESATAPPQRGSAELPALALFQAPDPTLGERATRASGQAPTAEEEGAAGGSGGASSDPQERRRPRRSTRQAGAPRHVDGVAGQASESVPAADAAERSTQAAEASTEAADGATAAEDDDEDDLPRRRRRRGGRRRRRPASASGEADTEDADDEGAEGSPASGGEADADADSGDADAGHADSGQPDSGDAASSEADSGDDEESGTGRRRRRRRRRAGVAEEMEDLSSDDPPNTVVKVREGRRATDEITGVRGSTRIEAKKQRRRDGREAGRRRAPILTEAEFLARRESVNRVMCVRQNHDRTQIAVLEDGVLVEHYVNRAESSSMVGNVYLGRVQNVLPSMEAAFVDVGRGRNAVLYAGEVNWDAAGLEGQPKRIELALKSGDSVLVQVTKDPIGHKGARLTSQISLPGRFLVYVPEGSMTGISRKLPDTERARLKSTLKDVVPEGAGVIVRTAAEGASEEQLTADVNRLTAQWADIGRKAKSGTAPTLLYGEPDLAIKVVRDIFNEDFTSLLVQGEDTWETLASYIGWMAPDLLGKLQKWVEPEDLYTAHRIDEQLAKALDRKVWLPSGGSLVIDRTEAMTVIDVNTGKFTGQGGNLEETVTRNNLEAAEETVRQLRLRDIGGIVVVDFIDMVLESNRDLVLRRLVECLGRDRTKHQVAEVTSLGLVQMTRKRIGQGLLEVFSTPCEACGGRGHIVHTEPVGSTGGDEQSRGRERDRGRRGQRQQPPPHLGGRQTGKTPPPPSFDEHGHIEHPHEGPPAGEDTPEQAPTTEPGDPSSEQGDQSSYAAEPAEASDAQTPGDMDADALVAVAQSVEEGGLTGSGSDPYP